MNGSEKEICDVYVAKSWKVRRIWKNLHLISPESRKVHLSSVELFVFRLCYRNSVSGNLAEHKHVKTRTRKSREKSRGRWGWESGNVQFCNQHKFIFMQIEKWLIEIYLRLLWVRARGSCGEGARRNNRKHKSRARWKCGNFNFKRGLND